MAQKKEKKAFTSLDYIDVKTFVEYLHDMRNEMEDGIDDDNEYEGELNEPMATIDNLLDLLDGVDNIQNVDLHHGIAILAHLQLLQSYLNMFSEDDNLEEEATLNAALSFIDEEVKPPKKETAKKSKKRS